MSASKVIARSTPGHSPDTPLIVTSSFCWHERLCVTSSCIGSAHSARLQTGLQDACFTLRCRIQEKDVKLKSMEESLQAAQESSSAREQTAEVFINEILGLHISDALFLILFMYCSSLSLLLKLFLTRRLWSSSWTPCRQRWSSWDRRRRQKCWPVLIPSSKNSRLSELLTHTHLCSRCSPPVLPRHKSD